MLSLELRAHVGEGREGDGQGGVGAPRLHLREAADLHRPVVAVVEIKAGARSGREAVQLGGKGRHVAGGQGQLHRLLAHGRQARKADAVGGEDPGQRMQHHLPHTQRLGHLAGVLTARPAEGDEGVAGDIAPPLDGDLLDRPGHVLHGDVDEPLRQHRSIGRKAAGAGHLFRQSLERRGHCACVERQVPGGAEHAGEQIGLQPAQKHIAVRHRQRPAAAIAGGAGICARRVRANPKARAVEAADGAAPRRHGVQAHHRRPQPNPGDAGVIGALIVPGVMGDVGGGAAHVKADQPVKARRAGRLRHADNAARGPRQHRVLAPKARRVGQATVRLHEIEPDVATKIARHSLHIVVEHRGEIGVGDGRIAPPDELDQRAHLMADGDLGEADPPCDFGDGRLMRGVAIAVHQDDGDAAKAVVVGGGKPRLRRRFIKRPVSAPVRQHSLVDLHHMSVEGRRLEDVPVKEAGPRLIADHQRIGVPLGDGEHRGRALALQKGVGGDRRAHADGDGEGPLPRLGEDRAHAFGGGVGVAFRVLGEKLAHHQPPVRRLADDVGEGAAAINEKRPA